MMWACWFAFIVYDWSIECNWVYHFYSFSWRWQRQNSPSLWISFCFVFLILWWRRHYILANACFYKRAYACLHHQVARAANPLACGRFPMMQRSGTVCDWPQSGGGQLQVWLADAMHLGMLLKVWFSEADLAHKKKKRADIYLALWSFCVISGWVILALISYLFAMSYLASNIATVSGSGQYLNYYVIIRKHSRAFSAFPF